ncbi:hypothetical protein FB451DRAFT_1212391 [Mycena latifolia]|nr:hypothetical protein FB451DRAFT_1212391 [Mycena latifolia]
MARYPALTYGIWSLVVGGISSRTTSFTISVPSIMANERSIVVVCFSTIIMMSSKSAIFLSIDIPYCSSSISNSMESGSATDRFKDMLAQAQCGRI